MTIYDVVLTVFFGLCGLAILGAISIKVSDFVSNWRFNRRTKDAFKYGQKHLNEND